MRYSSLQRPYTFHLAADWAAKPPWDDTPKPKHSFRADNPIVSWRDKSLERLFRRSGVPPSAGEDSFFCANGVSLGVADGVGGWAPQGIDSSMFSQALMYYAHGHFKNGWAGEPEIDPTLDHQAPVARLEGVEMTPSACLRLAYHDVLADESVEAVSSLFEASPACLLTLNSATGLLRSANLGDSGFCIIRASSVFYESSPQTHYFNCPKQLAKLRSARGRIFEDSIRDNPKVAHRWDTTLRDGDIVILYTDGLADNVFTDDIVQICSLVMSGPGSEAEQVQSIARSLVHHARRCMFSQEKVSPFQLEAKRHRKLYQGGVCNIPTPLHRTGY
ncbi:phosphatase 2C-like domain-containing protein [Mycena vulgaris]|nr:phosphatase 2C-like domain-containing protein [Mycena vulgaris]